MDINVERPVKLVGVAELRSRARRDGGSFVVFLSCASLVFFTYSTAKVVWIPRGQSRSWKGLAHSMPSLLLGWWSFAGFIGTLRVLAHNVLGGFDLTGTIMDPSAEDGEYCWEKADALRAFQRRRFTVFLALLSMAILFIVPLILCLLLDVVSRWLR